MTNLWNRLNNSPTVTKFAIAVVAVIWLAVIILLLSLLSCQVEVPVVAQPPTAAISAPVITLDPATGPVNTTVMVRGQGWAPGSTILFFVVKAGESETGGYALASAMAGPGGRFAAPLLIPAGIGLEAEPGLISIIARSVDGQLSAGAYFNVIVAGGPSAEPTSTPTPPLVAPTNTPTSVPLPAATATPIPPTATQPLLPQVSSLTNLNIRSGPGTEYPVIGLLKNGQSAEVTGQNLTGSWWQIRFSGAPGGRGWVSAGYVEARNVTSVPVVQAPVLPVTATPTPSPTATATPPGPVVITDWRGEYFNNPTLSGAPVVVRNDWSVDFSWGDAAPAPGVPADSFSVRWTRDLDFSAGTYRFSVLVDDGARLWIDGRLVLDEWRTGPPNTFSTEVNLSEGRHNLRLEYFDDRYNAQIRLSWDRSNNYPDWKAEYFNNRKLDDDPVVVRNEHEIDHNWGSGSPDPAVPDDNFSARWTQAVDLREGIYTFRVKADDGVRVWLDQQLLFDAWTDGQKGWLETERTLQQGEHDLKVEYYEHHGDAEIEFEWERRSEPANQAPHANAGGDYALGEGSSLTLDGRSSYDPDGSITRYEWDFDYDGAHFDVQGLGVQVSTSYPDGPARHIVALRVTDNQGATQLDTAEVVVYNVAPSVNAGGSYLGQAGNPITFNGSASDPSPQDQQSLSYRWDFGDGQQANGSQVSHSYAQAGIYTARLTVTDKDGGQSSDQATVEVVGVNKPPQAVIDGPSQGQIGETLTFSGQRSSDPDGQIRRYLWAFGDRSVAAGPTVEHSYSDIGQYEVQLVVVDEQGARAKTSVWVTIDEPVQSNEVKPDQPKPNDLRPPLERPRPLRPNK